MVCATQGMKTVLGAIIMVSLLPVVVPVLVILWLWRCLALLAVFIKNRRTMYVASGLEAVFATDSAGARGVISGVLVMRGRLEIATVRARLKEQVLDAKDRKGRLLHPKFRQVVKKQYGVVVWFWEDNFQVASHVREMERELRDEVDLLEEIAARSNLPFVRGHSGWEMLLASLASYDKQYEPHTAVMVRIHHALGDGRSFIGLLLSALVDHPLEKPQSVPVARHHQQESRFLRWGRFLWAVSNTPWVIRRVMRRGESSSLHGCRLEGSKLLAWSSPLSLATLKLGRSLAGVTVNDLLMAGLAQALHRHLKSVGGAAPQRLVSVLAVDVTAPDEPLSVANRLSLCSFSLPTGSMTPVARLEAIHKRLEALKASPDIWVNYLWLDLLTNLLPSPLAAIVLNTHGVTLVASNLPGPQETIHVFGGAVDDIMFWIPNKNRTGFNKSPFAGVGVSMLSYRGQVRLGVNIDSALVKSEEAAHQLIEDAVVQTTSLLMDLRAAEADSGNALGTESERLLGERTLLPAPPARGRQPPLTSIA